MKFQSTPAIAGGRTPCQRIRLQAGQRFNPRPPLLAGEPAVERKPVPDMSVSIHARHCWRANRINLTRW